MAQLAVVGPGRESFRAHLQLLQQPGAGAWLHAPPAENLSLHVAPALFRRLRLPVSEEDIACPFCDGVADRWGDHARVCPCGGDRTKWHNRLLAGRAQSAGLSPEVEKLLGLLAEDGARGTAGAGGGRQPADVWVGSWGAHGPAAFDLAVTSGMRQGCMAAVPVSGGHAAEDYESRKRTHLRTEAMRAWRRGCSSCRWWSRLAGAIGLPRP